MSTQCPHRLSTAEARAASTPATGSVMTQAATMFATVRQRTDCVPARKLAPTIAPVETCVVETGSATNEASSTRLHATVDAVKPSSGSMSVTFSASVVVTRRP